MKTQTKVLLAAAALALALATVPGTLVQAEPPDRHFTIVDALSLMDNDTGLQWERYQSGPLTQPEAVDYCQALDISGRTDWRLPTVRELPTIVDELRRAPAYDNTLFANGPGGAFWTSSRFRGTVGGFWYVEFAEGSVLHQAFTDPGYARCVLAR